MRASRWCGGSRQLPHVAVSFGLGEMAIIMVVDCGRFLGEGAARAPPPHMIAAEIV